MTNEPTGMSASERILHHMLDGSALPDDAAMTWTVGGLRTLLRDIEMWRARAHGALNTVYTVVTDHAVPRLGDSDADIVERLRKRQMFWLNGAAWMMGTEADSDCAEAADEIERLRADVAAAQHNFEIKRADWKAAADEIERLRAENAGFRFRWKEARRVIIGCNYPDCDGGPAAGYCHVTCREALRGAHDAD
jgi:hypothetical protein